MAPQISLSMKEFFRERRSQSDFQEEILLQKPTRKKGNWLLLSMLGMEIPFLVNQSFDLSVRIFFVCLSFCPSIKSVYLSVSQSVCRWAYLSVYL